MSSHIYECGIPRCTLSFAQKIGYTIPCSGLESRILSLNTCHKLGHSMSHVPFAPPRSWSLQLSFVPPQWRRPPNLAQDICESVCQHSSRQFSTHPPPKPLFLPLERPLRSLLIWQPITSPQGAKAFFNILSWQQWCTAGIYHQTNTVWRCVSLDHLRFSGD
jgi:hypothetical protein